jgi:hypothetical protein
MTILDVLKKGMEFANADDMTQEMLADFKDHRVGMKLDNTEITMVVKDGVVSIENGMQLDNCHAAMKMKNIDVCGAIDNSFDLMEIREKGALIKGDPTDMNIAVHFMATFPYFDAMVRLYQDDAAFKKMVDDYKATL